MRAIILAAGKGKRLQSEEALIPKHLREVNGKPILQYVLDAVDFVEQENIVIVVGFMKETIMQHKLFTDYNFAVQGDDGYGTGYAVKSAIKYIENYNGNIITILGDTPLINKNTLKEMYQFHKTNNIDCTILSCVTNDEMPLGRIIKDSEGKFCGIIEDKDCTFEQKKIYEYNTGVMISKAKKLAEELNNLTSNNKQNEYYLTDIPKLFLQKDYNVKVYASRNKNEILGINTLEELELVENIAKVNSTK